MMKPIFLATPATVSADNSASCHPVLAGISAVGEWLTLRRALAGLLGPGLLLLATGCATTPTNTASLDAPSEVRSAVEPGDDEVFKLQEGDVLKISFPDAPNLDSTQTIRRDGKISLAMVGEVPAVDFTPAELETRLRELYAPQLVSNIITVVVESSSYAVFVSGAVLRPGKIMADRPLTALEAVMEAGGFDQAKADMTAVRVIRQEGGKTNNHVLNLKEILDGKASRPFYLRKSDIIYVPEKFSWF